MLAELPDGAAMSVGVPTGDGTPPELRVWRISEASQKAVLGSHGSTAMSRLVYFLNGPNLNLLGKRQPHIYGHETLADVEAECRKVADELALELRFHQSNREYEIIDWIHEARETAGGLAINPAAFTHTSVAILDALNTCEFPVVEVHISNVHKREAFRHHSYVSLRADGVIAGFGTQGYQLALRRLARLIDEKEKK
jgi:3-dehydroquinate dehydratase-2